MFFIGYHLMAAMPSPEGQQPLKFGHDPFPAVSVPFFRDATLLPFPGKQAVQGEARENGQPGQGSSDQGVRDAAEGLVHVGDEGVVVKGCGRHRWPRKA